MTDQEICPTCQNRLSGSRLGCATCRDRWHERPLIGTPMERLFAHVIRGGKLPQLEAEAMRKEGR